jgi:hypothetical protein
MMASIVVAVEVPREASFVIRAGCRRLPVSVLHLDVLITVPDCSRRFLLLLSSRRRCSVRTEIDVLRVLGRLLLKASDVKSGKGKKTIICPADNQIAQLCYCTIQVTYFVELNSTLC